MCSRSFRRSSELRRHTSSEHNDALERIARLEKALEKLTGNKSELPPSPTSSTNERSASPEPRHHSSSEEILLDSATINAQFLLVDRAMNDVLIRLDCLERARKADEHKLRRPTNERETARCRCGTPREKIIERRARSLAQRIERGPQQLCQQSVSQESRMDALETTLDRMTTGLQIALGTETSRKAEIHQSPSAAGGPAWISQALPTTDLKESRANPSESHHNNSSGGDVHNQPVTRTLPSEEVEEQMDIDQTQYGPSLWDRRQESMTEEVMRVASRGLSVPRRVNGAGSTWSGDVTQKTVELGLR
ncbi:hypothetical protein EG328_000759 [Venturia inaequalis]|uniref:Uncharacterized protein n=1 Tax=Venturia inaequalis TaxID=5025 RepID=A0A8H3U1L7_VENIN|nr:hypothetical protein EG328_000759 [Venturia inaequalis]RDI83621.1 hypothetical protein Vi05172_g6126 [Venturia inaequalis]